MTDFFRKFVKLSKLLGHPQTALDTASWVHFKDSHAELLPVTLLVLRFPHSLNLNFVGVWKNSVDSDESKRLCGSHSGAFASIN